MSPCLLSCKRGEEAEELEGKEEAERSVHVIVCTNFDCQSGGSSIKKQLSLISPAKEEEREEEEERLYHCRRWLEAWFSSSSSSSFSRSDHSGISTSPITRSMFCSLPSSLGEKERERDGEIE